MGYGQVDQTDRGDDGAGPGPAARDSLDACGAPVGAVLAVGGELIAAGHNERVQAAVTRWRTARSPACATPACRPSYAGRPPCTPRCPLCQMCSGAILLFQIPRVVVGERERNSASGYERRRWKPGGQRREFHHGAGLGISGTFDTSLPIPSGAICIPSMFPVTRS